MHVLVENSRRLLAFESYLILLLISIMGTHYGIFCHPYKKNIGRLTQLSIIKKIFNLFNLFDHK